MLESLDNIKTIALSELQKTSDMETLRLWYSTHLSTVSYTHLTLPTTPYV